MQVRKYLDRWGDETKMAFVGIGTVIRQPRYAILALLSAALFAYAFALFKDGTSTWNLLWSSIGLGDKLGLLVGVWARILINFADWWGMFLNLLAILQGLNIALLVFSWRMRLPREDTIAGLEASGVGAAVSLLAVGCPACGTSLLVPLLTTMLGSGAAVFAETLGWALMVIAVLLSLFATRRLGHSAYITIRARRHKYGKKD